MNTVKLTEIMALQFLNNSVQDYCIAVLIVLGGIIILELLRLIVLRHIKKLTEKTSSTVDDFFIDSFRKHLFPVFYFIAFYLGFKGLVFSETIKHTFQIVVAVGITFFSIRYVLALTKFFLESYWKKRNPESQVLKTVNGFMILIQIVLWILALLIVLDNIGIKISALVAGLGIGGIAVALAAQTILSDLFSYITIFMDRPFEVGDFIVVDNHKGTIEHIGIKTTRLRSISGEQLIISNRDLTSARLKNMKRMEKRRIAFTIGVVYQTPVDQLKKIPGIIQNIIQKQKSTEFERSHLASIGESAQLFETVYYILSQDYALYMDTQQEIYFELLEVFQKEGIEFAYPTRTIISKP